MLFKCKNCGQNILTCKMDHPEDVLKSLKENGYYESATNGLVISRHGNYSLVKIPFQFLGDPKVINGINRYEIEDYELYENVRRIYENDDVLFVHSDHISNRIEQCPVCGSHHFYEVLEEGVDGNKRPWKHNYIYFYPYNDTSDTLHYYVEKADAKEIEPKVGPALSTIQQTVDLSRVIQTTGKIELTPYIKSLLSIKTNIYALEQRLRSLLFAAYHNQQHLINTECKIKKESQTPNEELTRINQSIKEVSKSFSISPDWYKERNIHKPVEPSAPDSFTLSIPVAPNYKKPGLFNKNKVEAENEELRKKYAIELENYDYQKKKYDDKVQEYKTQLKLYSNEIMEFKELEQEYYQNEFEKWIKVKEMTDPNIKELFEKKKKYEQIIADPDSYVEEALKNSPAYIQESINKQELQKCEDALKKAYQIEHDYLSANIVFPKYATLAAISTIYEYLVTGRCSELSGPTGAYNLYESELRANRIIDQLDSINENLNQIKNNQYMLFQAINSINSQLASLNQSTENINKELKTIGSSLDDISKATSVIAYNTSVTAFYSKVTAELTNSLGYLIAMK